MTDLHRIQQKIRIKELNGLDTTQDQKKQNTVLADSLQQMFDSNDPAIAEGISVACFHHQRMSDAIDSDTSDPICEVQKGVRFALAELSSIQEAFSTDPVGSDVLFHLEAIESANIHISKHIGKLLRKAGIKRAPYHVRKPWDYMVENYSEEMKLWMQESDKIYNALTKACETNDYLYIGEYHDQLIELLSDITHLMAHLIKVKN